VFDTIAALLGALTFWWVAAAVFCGGLMRGFVGFGGAMVMVPSIALGYDVITAVPVAALAGVPSMVQLLPTAVRHSERSLVLPIVLAVMLFAPLGTVALVALDPSVLKLLMGALVLAMTGLLAAGWQIGQSVPLLVLFGAGATGGLVQGVAGIGGPPVVAVALSRAGSATQQRANVIGVMTGVSASALAPLWYFGLITLDVLALALLFMPCYSAGTWIGTMRFVSGGHRWFRPAALGLLALIGVVTMTNALSGSV
jgi:hypothetical protein